MISTPSRKKNRLPWLQIAVHTGAWIPLAVLIYQFLTDRLTVNPIQAATQRTGDIALILLILSLACTPLNAYLKFSPALKVRRALGLYGYMYAAIHLLIFTGVDYGFNFKLILETIVEKRFVLIGIAAFLVLSILALTSFRWWMARMGKNWKRLHRLVYLVNLLVVLHFGLAVKGDLLRLQGDIGRPILAGVVVILLLFSRLPVVKKGIKQFSSTIFNQFSTNRTNPNRDRVANDHNSTRV